MGVPARWISREARGPWALTLSFNCLAVMNSLRPSAASCSKQFSSAGAFGLNFKSWNMRSQRAQRTSQIRNVVRRRRDGRQLSASDPMLGRDNLSHDRRLCPNVLDRSHQHCAPSIAKVFGCPLNALCPSVASCSKNCLLDSQRDNYRPCTLMFEIATGTRGPTNRRDHKAGSVGIWRSRWSGAVGVWPSLGRALAGVSLTRSSHPRRENLSRRVRLVR
jgi:hypothetical protein